MFTVPNSKSSLSQNIYSNFISFTKSRFNYIRFNLQIHNQKKNRKAS